MFRSIAFHAIQTRSRCVFHLNSLNGCIYVVGQVCNLSAVYRSETQFDASFSMVTFSWDLTPISSEYFRAWTDRLQTCPRFFCNAGAHSAVGSRNFLSFSSFSRS